MLQKLFEECLDPVDYHEEKSKNIQLSIDHFTQPSKNLELEYWPSLSQPNSNNQISSHFTSNTPKMNTSRNFYQINWCKPKMNLCVIKKNCQEYKLYQAKEWRKKKSCKLSWKKRKDKAIRNSRISSMRRREKCMRLSRRVWMRGGRKRIKPTSNLNSSRRAPTMKYKGWELSKMSLIRSWGKQKPQYLIWKHHKRTAKRKLKDSVPRLIGITRKLTNWEWITKNCQLWDTKTA